MYIYIYRYAKIHTYIFLDIYLFMKPKPAENIVGTSERHRFGAFRPNITKANILHDHQKTKINKNKPINVENPLYYTLDC